MTAEEQEALDELRQRLSKIEVQQMMGTRLDGVEAKLSAASIIYAVLVAAFLGGGAWTWWFASSIKSQFGEVKKTADGLSDQLKNVDGYVKTAVTRIDNAANSAAQGAIAAVESSKAGQDGRIVPGTIIVWNPGHPIPPGWVLCDGNNGTPKLSNMAIQGAGLGAADNKPGEPIQWFVGTSDPAGPIQTASGRPFSMGPLHYAAVLFIMKT